MMRTVTDGAAGPDGRLVVMLPGADMHAEEFRREGFFDAARAAGVTGRLVAVETGMEAYLDDVIVPRLHDGIVVPAAARELWLVGISLGGMGALAYAQAHPERVAGLVLLAPFIGSRGLVAEVEAAGGLGHWQPAAADTPEQRRLVRLGRGEALADAWLGYGRDDRFAAAHRLLASRLPAARVTTVPGGHDWPTWRVLWQEMLRTVPFAARSGGAP